MATGRPDPLGLSDELAEVAVEVGEGQANVEHLVGADRVAERLGWLVPHIYRCRLHFSCEGHRDQSGVLAVGAGDLDQRLVVGVRHQVKLAFGKALPALRALESAGLPAKDIENIHGRFVPGFWPVKSAKLIPSAELRH